MTPFPTKTATKNRRRFIRIPSHCRLMAQRILFSAKADTETLGEARNIGAGGLLFVAAGDYHQDDLFKVTITIPRLEKHQPPLASTNEYDSNSSITAVCQVTRSRQLSGGTCEVGAKFVNVYDDDMTVLRRFIESEAERLELAGHRS